MSCLLQENKFECRVSSVLNRNTKSYGKQFMFDNNSESCWSSDSVILLFLYGIQDDVTVSSLEIQFQGGFAGSKCSLTAGSDVNELKFIEYFYPEDINSIQTFHLESKTTAKIFRISFESSSDFFGRIIVYKLSMKS